MSEILSLTDCLPSGIDPDAWNRHCLLTVSEMMEADRAAVSAGISGISLMRAAGAAVAQHVRERYEYGNVTVLCGPGNNGGDGFVIARALSELGWTVRLGLLGDRGALTGDAALAAEGWKGPVEAVAPDLLDGASLVIDALFGSGLNRAPSGAAAATLAALGTCPVITVDVPSGVLGDSGSSLPPDRPHATATVTFFRAKPGHWLLPGRLACGELQVADIGIPESVLDGILPRQALNHPALWSAALPAPSPLLHKYSRGHVLIAGGSELLGATFLATRAAQRAGAGIVTVGAPVQQGPLYRLALESAVVRSLKDTRAFLDLLEWHRIGSALIGPGLGLESPGNHEKVLAVLRSGIPAVLDADALSLYEPSPGTLFEAIRGPVLLTPHDGEFRRLFPDLADLPDKLDRARQAAARSGAVILLKGYDTVIAEPEGHAVINGNAPATLATAGAGDVLAGAVAAFIAGGMPVFAAACAAAYVHGAAAAAFGSGLIASDLPDLLPAAIDAARMG